MLFKAFTGYIQIVCDQIFQSENSKTLNRIKILLSTSI